MNETPECPQHGHEPKPAAQAKRFRFSAAICAFRERNDGEQRPADSEKGRHLLVMETPAPDESTRQDYSEPLTLLASLQRRLYDAASKRDYDTALALADELEGHCQVLKHALREVKRKA